MSPEIRTKRGVRQGCVLSPCLFILYTENIVGTINANKSRQMAEQQYIICAIVMTVLLAEPHWKNVRYENKCKEEYEYVSFQRCKFAQSYFEY